MNPSALVGFLHGRMEQGEEEAFDEFLDSPFAELLDAASVVSIAVQGPTTPRSRDRILRLIRDMPVAQASRSLFGWHRNLGTEDAVALVDLWSESISTQDDYNALIDWLNLLLHDNAEIPTQLRSQVHDLVVRRRDFPAVGQQSYDWRRLASAYVADHAEELLGVMLDLIDNDNMRVFEGDHEAQLLQACVAASPAPAWAEIAGRLEAGAWRLQMEIRGWLAVVVPTEIIESWVNGSVERARLVATIAPIGGEEPAPIARFLLAKFGEDDKVSGSLVGQLISGSWVGPESDRLSRQIDQMNGWRSRSEEPVGVRTWAAKMVAYLEKQRTQALQREAERGF